MSTSVCGDLLSRLETKLPGGSPLIKTSDKKSPIVKDEDVLKDLVEQNKQILRKMEAFNNGAASFPQKDPVMSGDFPIEEIKAPAAEIFKEEIPKEEPMIETPLFDPQSPPPAALEKAHEDLLKLVEDFNISLEKWYRDTGCVVNFSWKYKGKKFLEVDGIDYIVYRKEAPTEERMKALMDRYNV